VADNDCTATTSTLLNFDIVRLLLFTKSFMKLPFPCSVIDKKLLVHWAPKIDYGVPKHQ
jgi:hypothetical protein